MQINEIARIAQITPRAIVAAAIWAIMAVGVLIAKPMRDLASRVPETSAPLSEGAEHIR